LTCLSPPQLDQQRKLRTAIGIQQCNLRFVAICNIAALLFLFPTFFFVFENLIRHSRLYIKSYPSIPPRSTGFDERMMVHHYNNLHHGGSQQNHGAGDTEKSNNTLWILCWLELAHLVPLSASLLYLLFLYRYLNYYTHFWSDWWTRAQRKGGETNSQSLLYIIYFNGKKECLMSDDLSTCFISTTHACIIRVECHTICLNFGVLTFRLLDNCNVTRYSLLLHIHMF